MKLDLYLELSISGTQNVIHSFILIHCPQYSLPTATADSSSAKIKIKKKKKITYEDLWHFGEENANFYTV